CPPARVSCAVGPAKAPLAHWVHPWCGVQRSRSLSSMEQTPALKAIGRDAARLLGQFSPIILSNRAPVEPLADGRLAPGAGGLVNEAVARTALATARLLPRRPLFLTQDYQLYLAPELIRSEMPDAAMQHFVHIPWPEPRYLKVLPATMRDPIFKGLLANDIIGLQTSLDVHYLLRCCVELM